MSEEKAIPAAVAGRIKGYLAQRNAIDAQAERLAEKRATVQALIEESLTTVALCDGVDFRDGAVSVELVGGGERYRAVERDAKGKGATKD